ncbi:MAG: Ku protein [Acidobacteria bacterium]|nr:MAG: Ku protein [Acidobacteriota bacterium]
MGERKLIALLKELLDLIWFVFYKHCAATRRPETMVRKKAKKRVRSDNDTDNARAARPFWSGTLTFGLVSVPVDLYPGNRTNRAPLRMLGPEGEALSRRYYSEKTGRDLDDDEMIRGYEIEKDRFVVVSDEELERLAPEQSRDIDLRRFVPLEDIPPLYFDRSYFLAPGAGAEKAYKLLAQTMEKEQLAGVATFVMRGKQYVVAIFPENEILRAETMRFADEIRSPKEIGLPEEKKVPAAAVKKFEKLIEKHSDNKLDLKELKDEQTEKLLKLVEKKRKYHKDVVELEVPAEEKGKVIDLMAALKKSLAGKRKAA